MDSSLTKAGYSAEVTDEEKLKDYPNSTYVVVSKIGYLLRVTQE